MYELIKTPDYNGSIMVKVVNKHPYFEYDFPYPLTDEMKTMSDADIINTIKPYFIDRKVESTENILIDMCVRNPFIYDVQFEKVLSSIRQAIKGETYYPGAVFSIPIPNYEPKGYEGNLAMVTVNRPITIKEDTVDVYTMLEDYHNNGIVEILKWTDVIHLNPNDFKHN